MTIFALSFSYKIENYETVFGKIRKSRNCLW